ncbi:MAG: DMT family transporter [Patescibacteria group bacterium]
MNKGVKLAFVTAIISGFAVFFNKFAVGFWQNSSVYTTAKNLIAVLFLCSLLLLIGKAKELKKLSKKQWLQLVGIGLIGGSIPFLLFFKGLSLTATVNAAFIHKTLFVWVALMAVPFLKEKISVLQFVAMAVLLLGVYSFLSPGDLKIGYGEFLALIATLFWAAENVIAKKVLKNISAVVVGWGRMFFGSIFLLIYLCATGSVTQLWVFDIDSLGWLMLAGLFLFGYVITWYSALKHASAVVVSSILVLALPITALLNSVFVTGKFNTGLIFPGFLILAALLLIGEFQKRIQYSEVESSVEVRPH